MQPTTGKREAAFRDGRLAALFCSPTMELGVDIRISLGPPAQRPATPANYAQRSGAPGAAAPGAGAGVLQLRQRPRSPLLPQKAA